jgi:hypothetical protein
MHNPIRAALSLAAILSGPLTASAVVVPFTRADDLDFQGTFVLALTTRSDAQGLQIGDAIFSVDPNGADGVISGPKEVEPWGNVAYSGSASATDDANLSTVMNSIEWSQENADPLLQVTINGLTAGSEYKLQLLFQEGCCNGQRFTDITLDGNLIADEFAYGPQNVPGQAVVQKFIASGTSALVQFPYATTSGDHNATINALTVELIPEPSAVALLSVGTLALLRRRRRA